MNVRKAFFISVFSLVMVAAFASSAFCWYGQRVFIPYVSLNSSSGYWTGVAIHNNAEFGKYYDLFVYDSTGTLVDSDECNFVDGGGISVNLLENWFGTLADGRYALVVETHSASSAKFSVTIFMGNNGKNNPGFAFQAYDSEISGDHDTLTTVCNWQ